MSLIGPRPALPAQSKLTELRKKNGSLNLRPGISGLAQVNGHDFMTDETKSGWDEKYLREMSLLLDVKIILKTILYLLKPPPVY